MSEGIFDISMNSLSDDTIMIDETGNTIEEKQEQASGEAAQETASAAEQSSESTQQYTEDFIEFNDDGLSEDDQHAKESEETQEEEEAIIEDDASDQDTQGESQDSAKTSPSPIYSLASALYEDGILPNLDEENIPQDGQALANAVQKEIESGIENFIHNLPEDLKVVLSNYKEGVPLNDLLENRSAQMRYNSINDEVLGEDTNLQRQIITNDFKNRGFSDAKIKKYLDRFEDLGDLEEEAKSSLDSLKEFESQREEHIKQQTAQQKAAQEAQAQEMMKNIQNTVEEVTEIIPGVKINKRMRDKVFSSMTRAVDTDQYGNPVNALMQKRAENPIEFEMKLHYLFNVTKGFEDWSAISNKATTSAMSQFEKTISKGSDLKTTGKPASLPNTAQVDEDLAKGLTSLFGKK